MSLFSQLANLLSTLLQPARPEYTTIIYPIPGKAVVVHDGLGIRHKRTWYQYPEPFEEEDAEVSSSLDDQLSSNEAWIEPVIQTQTDNYFSGLSTGSYGLLDSCINP